MKFPTIEEMAQNVAEKVLDKYEYKGKTLREWVEIIYNAELGTNLAEVGTDCISRRQAIDIAKDLTITVEGYEMHNQAVMNYCADIMQLPPIHPVNNSEMPNSSDVISRQQAIDALNSRKTAEQCEAGKTRNWTVDICVDMIKQLPPIQPEIVRCKDCKYAEYIDDVQTLWCTECGQGRTVAPNDFCSYAERREVTT